MKKIFYPAVFIPEDEGAFTVTFPDLPECITCGDNMEQAYEMAVEALGLVITSRKEKGEALPSPSQLGHVNIEDGRVIIVELDVQEYLQNII